MPAPLSRRDLLLGTAAVAAAAAPGLATRAAAAPASPPTPSNDKEPFRYSLNTSTIRGQNLPLSEVVDIAAKAGYQVIEPWMGEIETYIKAGGSLPDLRKRIADHGLSVESAIGFAEWIVDDDERRAKGLEQAKHDMGLLVEIGGKRIAAPPVGAHNSPGPNLPIAAERYRALLELGEQMGIVPQAEVWGFSQTLSRVGETAYVAIDSGHPQACILPDVYHIFKGGSSFDSLKLISSCAIHVFHVNDYPAGLPRDKATDADRVYPGDGTAPLGELFRALRDNNYRGILSLELFNREYWKQDAFEVARTGLQKTRDAVQKALG